MDLFLHDAFDVALPPASRAAFFVDGRSLKLDDVLASPELAENLAFHEAWRAAFGVRATRLDFADYCARKQQPQQQQSNWPHIQATLVECSGLRVLAPPAAQQQMLARALEAYQSVPRTPSSNRALLLAKLADRFSANSIASTTTAASFVAEYARMVLGDPNIAPLERWAGTATIAESSSPKNVAEYYARASAAATALDLPCSDPLTGFRVMQEAGEGPLSCVELLRVPLMRDGFMWRRDVGGTALQVDPWTSNAYDVGAFRVARVPAGMLLRAVPPFMYARMLLTGDFPDPGSPCDFPRMVSDAPSSSLLNNAAGMTTVVESPDATALALSLAAGAYWLPPADGLCFGAASRAPSWATPLRAAMLGAMVKHAHALAKPPPEGSPAGELLFHQLVARTAALRRLGSRVFVTAPPGQGGSVGEVVLIDDRPNVWSVMSVLVTLSSLSRPGEWSVAVFCGSERARDFFAKTLLPHVPHARIELLSAASTTVDIPFDIESHNALLKSAEFWGRVLSPRALLVQDDGVIFRRGLDDDAELMAQHMVGAPWLDVPDNRRMLEAAGVGIGLVGNGGLSLRRVDTMREICETDAATYGRRLFNSGTQPVPEDVFFSAAVERRGLSCPAAVAARFAFEESTAHATTTYGMHKPWPYVARAEYVRVLDAFLDGQIVRGARLPRGAR